MGIRDLKNRASSIIQQVVRTQKPVVITKNNKRVARIVPIVPDVDEALIDLGLVVRPGVGDWNSVRLERLQRDATEAIAAISSDRDAR